MMKEPMRNHPAWEIYPKARPDEAVAMIIWEPLWRRYVLHPHKTQDSDGIRLEFASEHLFEICDFMRSETLFAECVMPGHEGRTEYDGPYDP
jgi:hypothetical protein